VKREEAGAKADHRLRAGITYGDYFEAAGAFIKKNNYEIISEALSRKNNPVYPHQISEINISLEKHGSFYHPSKVEAVAENSSIPFVLNVAVSKEGIECMRKEYATLKRLYSKYQYSFIPRVYGRGDFIVGDNLTLEMFFGEWFEGYNEFHISKDPSDGKEKILIWDNINGNRFVSEYKTVEIYRQAAMIMTLFYNLSTFEQIFPWHHAAGDFVVKLTEGNPDIKLITVRQYDSLFKTEGQRVEAGMIIEGLLMFLVVLSIRIRLDRLDGTGDIVWADSLSVEGTIRGFRDGIVMKAKSREIPNSLFDDLRVYLQSITENEFYELSKVIVGSFNQSAPDISVINQNISKHSRELFNALKSL
jgi:hypothetical protein